MAKEISTKAEYEAYLKAIAKGNAEMLKGKKKPTKKKTAKK